MQRKLSKLRLKKWSNLSCTLLSNSQCTLPLYLDKIKFHSCQPMPTEWTRWWLEAWISLLKWWANHMACLQATACTLHPKDMTNTVKLLSSTKTEKWRSSNSISEEIWAEWVGSPSLTKTINLELLRMKTTSKNRLTSIKIITKRKTEEEKERASNSSRNNNMLNNRGPQWPTTNKLYLH